jgi:hypothetical protein
LKSRVIAVLGTAAVLVSGATSVAVAAISQTITGGNTQITLNTHTMQVLQNRNFALVPIAGATDRRGVLRLPTTGGTASPPNYTIKQGGGFSLAKAAKKVLVTHLVFNTKSHQATGAVAGHGTIVVFVIGDPNAGNGGPGKVEFGGYPVKLSNGFARVLDNTYNTQVFAKHTAFGTGASTVYFH